MNRKTLLILVLAVLLSPDMGWAQYPFGKNKVSYSHKDWKVLQTDHVDIYYYPSEQNIVAFIAPLVEQTYGEFARRFNLEFRDRLPLVFYSSHYDFQQTNIIRSLISEYTGGFTDLVKGRIAIPFTGSMWELRHVVRHEMVHAFMLEKLAQVMSAQGRFNYSHPPLWFVEGMAEYFARRHADSQSHMFVRDALLHGRLLDMANIWRIEGSFMMYKQGESIVRYIATNFGDDAVVQILENWWTADQFGLVLKKTIGLDLFELGDAYVKAAKRKYYPAIMYGQFAPDAGKQLTSPRTFHSRPTASLGEDGQVHLYANCAHDGVINICRLKRLDGRLERDILVEGGRSSAFESIPAFRSKIESRGDTLVFVSKRKASDAIYLYDASRRRILEYHTFDGLSVISSPTLSPTHDRVVFSAIDTTGVMDLFLYDRYENNLTRLTHNPYTEEDPDFHPTKDLVIFSSDRCENGDRESQGIYMIDLATKDVTALTCGRHADSYPEWSPDGQSFVFTSDRDGIFNIYLYRLDEQTVIKQTSVLGGVTTPAFMPDGKSFLASGYYKGEFHLFEFPLKDGETIRAMTIASVDSTQSTWMSRKPREFKYTTQDYKQKLGLDFAGAGIAIDPDYGSLGNGGAIALSDILGNHQYHFFFGNTSEGGENFFKRLNVGVNYMNLSHRLNYSLGVFHLTSINNDFYSVFKSEKRIGVATGLSYPFSKFSRVDGTLVFRFIERESAFDELSIQSSFVSSAFLTYVADNTLWTIGGPMKGWRYYTTVGHTFDFRDRGFEASTMQFDIRKYFKITNRIILAERFITRHSYGSDLQIYYLGGPWDLRGYRFRQFFGRSTYLFNSELRFPLIDRFAMALPFGNLEFPIIRGALFFDAGKAERFVPFETEWLGSIGAGTELNIGYGPVIRVNFTRATDFRTISDNTRWELFIGLNY